MELRQWQESFRFSLKNQGNGSGLLAECGGPSLAARFSIYQKGYWNRVSGALKEDFLLTQRLLGQKGFEAAVRDFLGVKREYELELNAVSESFAIFLGEKHASDGIRLALKIDLLALESLRAPELIGEGCLGIIGLHPSVRFACQGSRSYVIWRDQKSVRRERISTTALRILKCFQPPGDLMALSERVERLGVEPTVVQATIAEWSSEGLILSYANRSESI